MRENSEVVITCPEPDVSPESISSSLGLSYRGSPVDLRCCAFHTGVYECELDSSSILMGFDDLPQSPLRLRFLLLPHGEVTLVGFNRCPSKGFHDVWIHDHFGVNINTFS